MPDDRSVLFASTQAHHEGCPPPPDRSRGYVWSIYPEHDVWVHDLASGRERRITDEWGYDAEATVSPVEDRIVFTSTRSGDLELWTCDLDGGDLFQVTDELGYDGGAFFSHDGEWLIFRSTAFTPGAEAEEHARYKEDLAQWAVRPGRMDLMLVRKDGSERRKLTDIGGASFAPYFFPDDSHVIFSSNHHSLEGSVMNFDLFSIATDGTGLQRVTTFDGFDSFPMFSRDGRYLAFSSNRGDDKPGDTNVFIAEWAP